MSKKIMILLLVMFLAGGGIAFAQYGPGTEFLGLGTPPPEIEGEEGGRDFGEEVSKLAREIHRNVILPEQAQGNDNGKNENDENGDNGEDKRSEVAKAVHKVLGGEVSPENGEAFGKAVSEQAKADGQALGQAVSEAARGANGSAGAGKK